MNKPLVFIGGILAILGVILPFIDKSMAWWMVTLSAGSNSASSFLSLTGIISNTENSNTTTIDDNSALVIVLILVLVGGVLALAGTSKTSGGIAVLGILVVIVGLVYFIISLPNIPEVANLLVAFDNPSYLYGSDEFTFIITWTYTWRIGNAFLVSAAGAVVGLLGSLVSSK